MTALEILTKKKQLNFPAQSNLDTGMTTSETFDRNFQFLDQVEFILVKFQIQVIACVIYPRTLCERRWCINGLL